MAWEKASEVLISLLEEQASILPCERRFMFGSPTFFVNNNMFAGVHEDTVILRLDEENRRHLQAEYDAVKPFTPMGRAMKEYVAVPEYLAQRPRFLGEWLHRSFAYAAVLPVKVKKPKTTRKPR